MDAARLLYGELDLDATSALFAVGQLDEGFDILADNINNSQESLNSISSSFSSFSEMADESTGVMKSFYETLDEISKPYRHGCFCVACKLSSWTLISSSRVIPNSA
jgi:methyl-accepting chemotaxis protein